MSEIASVVKNWRSPVSMWPTTPCHHLHVLHDRGSLFCQDCPAVNTQVHDFHNCDLCDQWRTAGVFG